MGVVRALVCMVLLTLPAIATPQPAQPPPAQGEFVPLSEVPPSEQIPAFTLVAAAYAAVWLVLLAYVWSVSQRLQKVERELATIDRRGT